MTPKLRVRTQGFIGRWLDNKFEGVMRYVLGVTGESPQKTHRWNNHHLSKKQVAHLYPEWMVSSKGDKRAKKISQLPILFGVSIHLTRFGGWKKYIVVAPVDLQVSWYIGWKWPGGAGVSRIPTNGPVRVLVGPEPVDFFGIGVSDNIQLPIEQIGEGQIGLGGEFSQIPLF